MTVILDMPVKKTQLRSKKRSPYSGKSQLATFRRKIKRVLDQIITKINKCNFSPIQDMIDLDIVFENFVY